MRHTRATPANVPRSRSAWTRRQRREIAQNCRDIQAMNEAYEAMYGDDDDRGDSCPECWGEGEICDCCDDICAARGDCMHGDGMRMCPACNGNGVVA